MLSGAPLHSILYSRFRDDIFAVCKSRDDARIASAIQGYQLPVRNSDKHLDIVICCV